MTLMHNGTFDISSPSSAGFCMLATFGNAPAASAVQYLSPRRPQSSTRTQSKPPPPEPPPATSIRFVCASFPPAKQSWNASARAPEPRAS